MTSLVEQAMATWLSNPTNLTKIYSAYQQKGGWEGWAQVEIAILLAGVPNSVVVREQAVYTNHPLARADVVLTINGIHLEILELKCHGIYRGQAAFVNAVKDDIVKVQTGTYAVSDVRPWAMVLVVDPAVKGVIKTAMQGLIRPGEDKVTEAQFAIPNTNQHVYLLNFVLPITIG